MFGVASYVLNTASSLVYGPTPLPNSSTSSTSHLSSSGLKKSKTKKQSRSSFHHKTHSTPNPNSSLNPEDHYRRSTSQSSQRKPTSSSTSTSNRSTSTSHHHHHHPSFSRFRSNGERGPGYDLVDQINHDEDLYFVLGFHQYNFYNRYQIKFEDIRKAYITRSRLCHPDKLPLYKPCTSAFQKLSFAYETLSKPSSRRLYDLNGHTSFNQSSERYKAYRGNANGSNPNQTSSGDETLNSVLHSTFCEFMDGDFEMIRVLINALNEGNPGLNLGEEAINNLETSFKKLRTILLTGQKYMKVIRFELIKLYEIQSSLRSLSYLNVLGRVRLSLALARVTLSIPMRIDQVMREKDSEEGGEEEGLKDEQNEDQPRKRRVQANRNSGILPRGVAGLLEATVAVLECGERATMWGSGGASSGASYEEEANSTEEYKSKFNERSASDSIPKYSRPTPLKRNESNQSNQSDQSFRHENFDPTTSNTTTNINEEEKVKLKSKEKQKEKEKRSEPHSLRRSKSTNGRV
ncbi:uncharacterized protein MELLADRAFT_115586 [Melampsora larici-populina 98AG31]|uniref:J domain-containing protein n=1 Tax=Melampsora larici-populina (strain 98AG31 / pathotype 3-4-7) TaxID=747676 RepID=F4RBX0_MELLP|nr:uncharacterized protein MELLADRAFT_115586 [Melampsora larici-populina 98AG31]EGG10266.1 hypothetical protein MELLADRAFT_115586 [Melampsora larici-populina 98AG31]